MPFGPFEGKWFGHTRQSSQNDVINVGYYLKFFGIQVLFYFKLFSKWCHLITIWYKWMKQQMDTNNLYRYSFIPRKRFLKKPGICWVNSEVLAYHPWAALIPSDTSIIISTSSWRIVYSGFNRNSQEFPVFHFHFVCGAVFVELLGSGHVCPLVSCSEAKT